MKRRVILRAVVAVVVLGVVAAVDGWFARDEPLLFRPALLAEETFDLDGRLLWAIYSVLGATYGVLGFVAYALLCFIPYFRTRATGCNCRRCGHTLRGLSEPKCPECGEAI